MYKVMAWRSFLLCAKSSAAVAEEVVAVTAITSAGTPAASACAVRFCIPRRIALLCMIRPCVVHLCDLPCTVCVCMLRCVIQLCLLRCVRIFWTYSKLRSITHKLNNDRLSALKIHCGAVWRTFAIQILRAHSELRNNTGKLDGDRLNPSRKRWCDLRCSLAIQMALALLACPLQLPGEEALVPVRLQAIGNSEQVYRDFCSGQTVAPVRHGSQPNSKAASTFGKVLVDPAFLCGGLFIASGGCLRLLLLFWLLLLKSVDASSH
jgi:hypothetical protein